MQKALLKWIDSLDDERAHTLDLNGRGANAKVIERLAQWPGVEGIKHLDLSGNLITGDALPALLEKVAPTLETLDLSKNARLREQGFSTLAKVQWPKLRTLRLRETKLRKGFEVLARLDAPLLEEVDAFHAGFGAAGARALASSAIVHQLKSLELEEGDPGQSGLKALLKVLPQTSLVYLGLGRRVLSAAHLEQLFSGPLRETLRGLSIRTDDDEDLVPLSGLPLRSLQVGAALFHKLPELPRLRRLMATGLSGSILAPLPERITSQLEMLRCHFPENDALTSLARTSTTLRVLEFLGGSEDGWRALAEARFVPYLEAMNVQFNIKGSLPHRYMPEILSRAESLRTVRVGYPDGPGLALRWLEHLDIERVVTTDDYLNRFDEQTLKSFPVLENAERIEVSLWTKIGPAVLKTFGDKVRVMSSETLDALAGLDFLS